MHLVIRPLRTTYPGGLCNYAVTENSDGDIINDTGHKVGFQVVARFDVRHRKTEVLLPVLKTGDESDFDLMLASKTRISFFKYINHPF